MLRLFGTYSDVKNLDIDILNIEYIQNKYCEPMYEVVPPVCSC